MSMENSEIAAVLEDVGLLLQIQGANPFRIRAYENAARSVEDHAVPLRTMVAEGADLTALSGIGKDMARYITELVTTGRLSILEELTGTIPRSLLELVRLPGVGPKRARKLWESLGVTTLDSLEAAARDGRVAELDGFGAKTQQRILDGIARLRERGSRLRLVEADERIAPLLDHLRGRATVRRLEVAGSLRRRVETIGDIDLLATADDAAAAMAHFTGFDGVAEVTMSGDTRGSVVLASGLQVDLRIVPEDSWGAALQYFTGSKAHNVKLRKRAVGMGLSISEYGVVESDGDDASDASGRATDTAGRRVAGATEESVYAAVELSWIPPELREDRGEIELAAAGALPSLITLDDVRGDLQMHTTWSDGKATAAAMVDACAARGYAYLAITDHSQNLAMTGGLDAGRLQAQWTELDAVMAERRDIRLLRSMEIDILRDGSLDLEDELIERLDVVLVSVHTLLDLPAAAQTKRILRALEHPRVHVLAHPTGRLINRRDPIAFDLDDVLQCARERGVAMELNAHPHRLDLRDTHLIRARELGIPIVISTDAHGTRDLDYMRYGVEQARRAGLEPRHVLNTRPLADLMRFLEERR
jgi:DNA polymerase (family 10)